MGIFPVPLDVTPLEPEWPVVVQQTLVQTEGLDFVRVMMVIRNASGTYYAGNIAYVPVYSTNFAPLGPSENSTEALRHYVCPDGRTLKDWHIDSGVGGPKAYSWPPRGSAIFTALASNPAVVQGCFTGRWSAPPASAQSAGTVLLGVGVISRVPTQTSGVGLNYFETGLLQVQGIPAEWNTQEFRDFYASSIDD